jgi:hypothetical protein
MATNMASSITNIDTDTDTDDKVIAWFLKRKDDIATLVQKCNNLNNYPPLLHALPLLRIPTNELHLVVPLIRTVRQGFKHLKQNRDMGVVLIPFNEDIHATCILLDMKDTPTEPEALTEAQTEAAFDSKPWQLGIEAMPSRNRIYHLVVDILKVGIESGQLRQPDGEGQEFVHKWASNFEFVHFTRSKSIDEYTNYRKVLSCVAGLAKARLGIHKP